MKKHLPTLVIIFGVALILAALFAKKLGIDNDLGWGKGRIALLFAGLLMISLITFKNQIVKIKGEVEILFGEKIWGISAIAIIFSIVFLTYLWFISVGLWSSFPKSSTYYDWLATSFKQGQLSLPFEPDPKLLALPDPYETSARSGINWPMDTTLFNGKYYLYFGPAPAIILTVIKLVYPGEIGDQFLVFLFSLGVFLFEFLILHHIWANFFELLPKWFKYGGIIGIGLANPFIIMLLSPGIHSAAISSGQFFLLGGLYFVIITVKNENLQNIKLTFASIFLTGAVASRSILALPVIGITLYLWLVKYEQKKENGFLNWFKQNQIAIFCFGVPLATGALALAWYNWARFGSPTNFGFMYALTTNNLLKIQEQIFSPNYILQNTYNYFLNPYQIIKQFPILQILDGKRDSLFSFISLPKAYYTENMVGLLCNTPYIILAIPTVIAVLFDKEKRALITPILTTCLATLLPLLAFFWVAFRYTADFFPSLGILSIIGIWYVLQHSNNSTLRIFLGILFTIIVLFSIITTDLLAISNAHGRFKAYNPELLEWMKHLLYFGK